MFMSRIAIVLFYDEKGIADGYFGYFLNELSKVSNRVVIVCNGLLTSESREMLKKYADDVYCRENTGFDAWGYRSAIIDYLGWDKLYEYDELILTNYTSYGPFYSLNDMFDSMDRRKKQCDCWSIFRNHKTTTFNRINNVPLKWGFIPESMTSNFWVIRNRLLHSVEFKNFYENLPSINSYDESTVYYEFSFTEMVKESGFLFDTFEAQKGNGFMHNAFNHDSAYMLAKENAPIFRRRNLYKTVGDSLYNFGYNDDSRKALEYIEQNTDYDTNLIWDNLLRSANQYDFFRALQLHYVLSSETNDWINNIQIAAVFYVGKIHEEMGWTWITYITNLPKGTDIFVYVEENEARDWILLHLAQLKINYELIKASKGLDVGALFHFMKNKNDYKYICFVNTYFTEEYFWSALGHSRFKRSLDGILENANYVLNILRLFEKNPRLGIVSAPLPYHGEFLYKHKYDWYYGYNEVKNIYDKFELTVQLDADKPPVRMDGRIMWFRAEALRSINEFELEFHKDEHDEIYKFVNIFDWIYPLVAQNSGFFPAYVESTEMARSDVSNFVYMLDWNSPPLQASLESVPAKLLFIKLCKRFIPKRLWAAIRRFGTQ